MRIARITLAALTLFCASCGDRTVQVATPMAQAQDRLTGDFTGRLVLEDGGRLQVNQGRLLGPWACGRVISARRDVCVEAAQVKLIEHDERHYGAGTRAGQVFGVIVMAPVIAVWMYFDGKSQRKSRLAAEKAADERRAAEARAAARGEVLPPKPTRESYRRQSAFYSLANCSHLSQAGRRETDGAALADAVWQDPQGCLQPAIEWFTASADLAKARRLTFLQSARRRYEVFACGHDDPGLDAPQREVIGGAAGWMDEYRAVVGDPDTYDYAAPDRPCDVVWVAGTAQEPEPIPHSAALARAVAGFPLTDLPQPGEARTIPSTGPAS